MSKWISVKDRLPTDKWHKTLCDYSKEKIVANSCAVSTAFYSHLDGAWYCGCPADSEKEWIDKVTHWMDLPSNPHFE